MLSDRVVRIAKISAQAEQVFGERARAVRWLYQPLTALGGKTPFEMIATEAGAARVEDVLTAIEHGVYA
ncbi:MAG TPA: MbcA/ParS/Xre antitoxin family protein [Burkholderiales bacterium]|nr:MbcA/ParS/Xre antitoxin family protein [Burkholderiales bacterium]